MDAFASAFGFDAKSDDVWTTLGKVTAVGSGTLSVLLGGSATPTECEAYCLAGVGDIVFVAITKGRARAIACKGVDAATWRTALGLGSMATEDSGDYVSKSDTIPINRGGTGATTAAGALANLGAASSSAIEPLDLSKIKKLTPSYWGNVTATSGGFDLGFKLNNDYTVYYSVNFSNSKFVVLLDDPSGTRVFNKSVTLS